MWFWLLILFFTENAWIIISICLAIGLIIGIYLAVKFGKRKNIMENSLSNDERFINSKTFISELNIPIMVSEQGYIGIIDHFIGEIKVIDIRNITGYKLQINDNISTFDSIGLLGAIFGKTGNVRKKVNNIKIILKIDNFNDPIIEIPFLSYEIYTDSKKYIKIQKEINQFIGTLDYLRGKLKDNNYAI